MRNTVEDKEKLAEKLSEEDIKTIKDALEEHEDWLSSNPETDKEDYEDHLKELQAVCDPIISKVYNKGG
jgi:heat shock protein 5